MDDLNLVKLYIGEKYNKVVFWIELLGYFLVPSPSYALFFKCFIQWIIFCTIRKKFFKMLWWTLLAAYPVSHSPLFLINWTLILFKGVPTPSSTQSLNGLSQLVRVISLIVRPKLALLVLMEGLIFPACSRSDGLS